MMVITNREFLKPFKVVKCTHFLNVLVHIHVYYSCYIVGFRIPNKWALSFTCIPTNQISINLTQVFQSKLISKA